MVETGFTATIEYIGLACGLGLGGMTVLFLSSSGRLLPGAEG